MLRVIRISIRVWLWLEAMARARIRVKVRVRFGIRQSIEMHSVFLSVKNDHKVANYVFEIKGRGVVVVEGE